jgi:S-adenosylmethionine-diacylglycerol 3-amino-3-carboxypropyl transferase
LAANVIPAESLELLGHLPMDGEARVRRWDGILERLGIEWDELAPRARVAEFGMDHCGRYEAAFLELRRLLGPLRVELDKLLRTTDALMAECLMAPETALGDGLDAAFASALRLENLVTLFGEGATRNPRRAFHEHFPAQLRDVVRRLPPAGNPWVWQLLAGKFPAGSLPDWLAIRDPLRVVPEFFCGTLVTALAAAEPAAFDFIHLSNVLDWLSPGEALATLEATHRALKPGGFALIRQLNSTLEIPSLFPGFRWHRGEGRALQQRDRSFFYPEIHLGSKR